MTRVRVSCDKIVKVKRKFDKTIVKPVMLYESKNEKVKMKVSETKILKWACGMI